MVKTGTGKILFTASIAGEMVAPREAVYAATKAFVLSFAHSLRYELRDTEITVTSLQPGPTDTDFFHRAGMDNTQVGQEGKSESQPDDVARQGIEALMDGKDHVYAEMLRVLCTKKWPSRSTISLSESAPSRLCDVAYRTCGEFAKYQKWEKYQKW
jgi:short-subunit dehydrogenase